MNEATGGIFTLSEQPFAGESGEQESEEQEFEEHQFESLDLGQQLGFEQTGYESGDLRIGEDVALGEMESEAQQSTAGGRLIVESLPLLRSHAGTAPDLVVFWNGRSAGRPVDVAVHLHGFSGRGRAMRLTRDMIPVCGLDFHDPDNPSSPGRTSPTLLVLPRGHFFGGRSGRGYTFPALHPPGALTTLVDDAVARVAAHTGVPLTRGRLTLTAHSGGGASLMRILRYADPDEVHAFDALYTDPAPLIAWVRKRISAGSGALRVIYRPGEGTAAHSRAVGAAIGQALSAAGADAKPRFRVEKTSVAHMQIPRRFGWRLLADVSADLPGVSGAPAGRTTGEAFEGFEGYEGYEGHDEFEAESACGCRQQHEQAAPPSRRSARTTAELRRTWARYACAEPEMVTIRLLSHRTPVNPLAVDAFSALGQALLAAGYQARSTWVYNCRDIRQTAPATTPRRSLHAYGLAVDIDPRTNPHRRNVRGPIAFSAEPTQPGREADVRAGRAGTAFTPAQIAAAEAIRTVDGLQVFGWGGRWRSSHDAMHFEIRLTPAELVRGIAASSASRPQGQQAAVPRTCEASEFEEYDAPAEDTEDADLSAVLHLETTPPPDWDGIDAADVERDVDSDGQDWKV
jgi:hypothetical protein